MAILSNTEREKVMPLKDEMAKGSGRLQDACAKQRCRYYVIRVCRRRRYQLKYNLKRICGIVF